MNMLHAESRHEETPLNSIIEVLEYFSLTPTQIRAYLYIAKVGEDKPINVSRAIGVHRTIAYKVLNELEDKGLLNRHMTSPITYTALTFREAIASLLYEKQRLLDTMRNSAIHLEECFEALKVDAPDEKRKMFTFMTQFYRRRLAKIAASSTTKVYHLSEEATRHILAEIPNDATIIEAYDPRLGDFVVFDDSLILLRQSTDQSWHAVMIMVPEIVATYQKLQGHLAQLQEVPAHVN